MSAKIPFDEALAEKFIGLLTTKYMSEICRMDGMPSIDTIYNWYALRPDFHESCRRARGLCADDAVDRHNQVIDDVYNGTITPEQGRVVLSALEKRMSILDRARYGDKPSNLTITNNTDNRRVDVNFESLKLAGKDVLDAAKRQITQALDASSDNGDK